MADEFDPTKKKKKKEVKMAEESENVENGSVQADSAEIMFGAKKKKKGKKPKTDVDSGETGPEEGSTAKSVAGGDLLDASAPGGWPDYSHDELLTRIFNIMKERNPEAAAGGKKKLTVKPPQVMKVGTKKTAFANFSDICKSLKRQPKHLLNFLLAELGTSGSVDGNGHLIIKGRFQQKHFEAVLTKYIKEYVTCHTCRSGDTILQKEDRLFFLQCSTCESKCSVAPIKTGFQAVTTKRAKIRAAAGL